jgi:anti-sigma regulatory factor (Ser/Thr protein kinase)
MKNLGYSPDAVDAMTYVYQELTSNAFEHGCEPASKDRVTILIEITAHYISLTVSNPPRAKFDLSALLGKQIAHLKKDSRSKRGRGLVICWDFADSLSAITGGEGVRALFFKPSVVLKLSQLDGLAILHVVEGLENPSIRRRIKALGEQYLDRDLILDLASFARASDQRRSKPATTVLTGSLELLDAFEQAGRKLIVLVPPGPNATVFRLGIFDPSVLAFSVTEAAQKLGRPELKAKIERLIRDPK